MTETPTLHVTGVCAVCRLRKPDLNPNYALSPCEDCLDLIFDSDADEHPMTRANACDVCYDAPLPGVLWSPSAIPVNGLQHVERCDGCERYPSDRAAAEKVAAEYDLVAVFDHNARPYACTEYWSGGAAVCRPADVAIGTKVALPPPARNDAAFKAVGAAFRNAHELREREHAHPD